MPGTLVSPHATATTSDRIAPMRPVIAPPPETPVEPAPLPPAPLPPAPAPLPIRAETTASTRSRRSRRLLVIGGTAGVAILVGALLLTRGGDDTPPPPAPIAVPEPEPAPPTPPAPEPIPPPQPEPPAADPADPDPADPATQPAGEAADPATPGRVTEAPARPGRPGKTVAAATRTAPDEPAPEPAVADTTTPARAAYNAGNQRLFAGDAAGAIESYRQALEIQPGFAAGYRGLGLAYALAGDRAKALDALTTYTRLAPGAKDIPLIEKRIAGLRGK